MLYEVITLNTAISKKRYLAQMETQSDKRIVFIFDECHRSQFGKTHDDIKNFFTKCQMFGFTGTRITSYNVCYTKLLRIKEESLLKLGYFLKPKELFSELAKKGNADTESESNYIIEDLQAVMNHIEQSTMGTESEDDFTALFEDLDLTSTKIGRTVGARNEIIVKILNRNNFV